MGSLVNIEVEDEQSFGQKRRSGKLEIDTWERIGLMRYWAKDEEKVQRI